MAESFETIEYDGEDLPVQEKLAALKQVFEDRKFDAEAPNIPTAGFQVHMQGDQMKIAYHCYEMHLHDHRRLQDVEDQARKSLDEMLKYLKKKYKQKTKKVLSVKEDKDLRNFSIQKVSLNERYYAIFWRVYTLD